MCDEIGLSNGDLDFDDHDSDLLYSNGHFLGNSPIGKIYYSTSHLNMYQHWTLVVVVDDEYSILGLLKQLLWSVDSTRSPSEKNEIQSISSSSTLPFKTTLSEQLSDHFYRTHENHFAEMAFSSHLSCGPSEQHKQCFRQTLPSLLLLLFWPRENQRSHSMPLNVWLWAKHETGYYTMDVVWLVETNRHRHFFAYRIMEYKRMVKKPCAFYKSASICVYRFTRHSRFSVGTNEIQFILVNADFNQISFCLCKISMRDEDDLGYLTSNYYIVL